jgi:hypothetical protein
LCTQTKRTLGPLLATSACAALRDLDRNPEWKFVREGPTWQGRRVATWDELLS